MLRYPRRLAMLVLLALVFCACQPIHPPAKLLAPELVGLRPDAPDYAKHGPFWVGYRDVVIGEGTAHPLQVGLWYPALNPQGVQEKTTYTIATKIPVAGMMATARISGHALAGGGVRRCCSTLSSSRIFAWFRCQCRVGS